ncbi:hypothetical protein MSAN_00150300 [Mycena sanguinolenta]|uniref:Uncharacterized protein n=1 Tax=Mycena sanguinolenta TaxID=230812 RepID=A0A8H6ZH81_9AGAR|nr:hypothetical protein MSAN_00150300 [Mycena sanguinolenta]
MFFSASIALTFAAAMSGIAVRSAPVARQADFVPQACSGPNLTGTCVSLDVAPAGQHAGTAGSCTNVSNPQSLKLNPDNDCVSFPTADCQLDFTNPNDIATEHFADDDNINNLGISILSIACEADPGFVDGLLAGFQG